MIRNAGGFGPLRGMGSSAKCETHVLVTGGERRAVTRALAAASPRLSAVGDDGQVWPDEQAMNAAGVINISYCSPVTQYVRGVFIWVDFDDGLPPAMGATFRAIVREELERAGVTDGRLALPTEIDRETSDQAMFVAAGVTSTRFEGVEPSAAIAALRSTLGDDVLVLATVIGDPPTGLLEHTVESPLDHLVLEDDSTGFYRGVAVPVSRAAALETSFPPVWFVRGETVLAHVDLAATRIRDDVSIAALDALRELAPPRTGARVVREWHDIMAARARARRMRADPQPVEHDWWDSGWRAWEPIGPAPAEQPPDFEPLQAAKRLRASTRGPWVEWRWWRAPFGPDIGRDEAWAWLSIARVSRSARSAAEELMGWDFPPVDAAEAQAAASAWRLPPAANIRALATIVGPEQALEWLYDVLGHERRFFGPEHARGIRAGLLPLMSEDQLAQLAERVRADCTAHPWTSGAEAPHTSYLLAGPLGLHDICEHVIATHENITGAGGAHLLAHGLRSAEQTLAVYREAPLHNQQGWKVEAFVAAAGPAGAQEAIAAPIGLAARSPDQAEACLWPLLRKPWPELTPGMTALLGGTLDKPARTWLKRNAG